MYQGAVLPFIEGIKYGLTIADYESSSNVSTQEFIMMDVEPKNAEFFDQTEINIKNGQQVMVRANNVSVIMNNSATQPLWWMIMNATYMALTIIVLILGVWIPFLVVKIIRSLQHSMVFERINLARINRIGLILLGIGIIGTIIQLINILSAEYMIELSHYNFSYSKAIDFNALIMGIVILIMSEVMSIATDMKEEQDLTI
jgi:hypothetical protein